MHAQGIWAKYILHNITKQILNIKMFRVVDDAAMAEWSKALGLRPTGHSRPRGFEPRWLHPFAPCHQRWWNEIPVSVFYCRAPAVPGILLHRVTSVGGMKYRYRYFTVGHQRYRYLD